MELTPSLKRKENIKTHYWEKIDYFIEIRKQWRTQMVRHLFHLLPGESILEIGCAKGSWTRVLEESTKEKNPISAVTFDQDYYAHLQSQNFSKNVEINYLENFPGTFVNKKFDFIVGWHMLPQEGYSQFLFELKKLLKPGGQILLFEPNPWNPYFQLRRLANKLIFRKSKKEKPYFNRIQMLSILSEIGYTKVKILPYDFLYPPIPRAWLWPMQNLSLIFENTPYFRNFAGDLFLWAQNPPPSDWKRPKANLASHSSLYNKVSVVVPCHNEEANIKPLVESILGFYNDYIYEIILVDDNSRDKTAEIGEQLGQTDSRVRVVRRSMPNGVGRALRDGLASAKGDFVLSMDCDFQHILPEMTGLFDAINEGADIAIGSRFSRKSVLLNYPFTKIIANRGFHILARLLLKKPFRDVTNNLKLMKKNVAKNINIESNDFAANAETGLKPILLGYKAEEVPISWINRSIDMGFSSFNLVNTGPNYIIVFFKLFWRQFRGKNIILKTSQVNAD